MGPGLGLKINRRGIGAGGGGPSVPLAGTWDGGFWHADDLTLANGAEVLEWAPREGSVSWIGTSGATCPTMSAAGFFGEKGVAIDGAENQRMRADALSSMQDGADTPITIWVAFMPTDTSDGALVGFTAAAASPYHQVYFNAAGNPSCLRAGAATAAFACPVVASGRSMLTSVFSGTANVIYHDKKASSGIAQDSATVFDVSQVVLGNFFRTSASVPFSGIIRAVGITSTQLTAGDVETLYNFVFGAPEPIWFLGDSITLGSGATGAAGMRRAVSDLIAKNNYRADMVGTLDTGTLWTRTKHNGHSGFDIDGITGVVTSNLGAGKTIPSARLVMVMVGTNDMGAGSTAYDGTDTPAKYAALLEAIHAAAPAARIAVTTIIPINPATEATADANRIDFNSKLPAIWDAFDLAHPSAPLVRWDAEACLGGSYSAGDYTDDFHLNDTGYAKINDDANDGLLQAVDPILAAL